MALIETEGLILKSHNLSDADKIVIFMTKEHGIVRGVAKGAKRLKSRYGGSLEPFSIVNLIYFQKEERELVSIRQIELEKSFFKNASDIDFLQKFGYMSELLIEFSPPHDPNRRLYQMARICLETASELNGNLDGITLYFELWLLRLGGFLPVWEICQRCRRTLNDEENPNLAYDFQLVCGACHKGRNGFQVTPFQRKAFLIAQKTAPKKFVELTEGNHQELRDLSSVLKRIIAQIIGKELSGDRIVRTLRKSI
jgi:DNA repair protein RecO (recombination protein O)